MINKILEIKNFKSIKHLKLDCKKINIFIGKPNTGKSNILESVGFFSLLHGADHFKKWIRVQNTTNLFYDNDLSQQISINIDNSRGTLKFNNGSFDGEIRMRIGDQRQSFIFHTYYDPRLQWQKGWNTKAPFKFYKFNIQDSFQSSDANFLHPPDGDNLLTILLTSKSLKKAAADIFSEYKLRIVLKPQERQIEVQKEVDDVVISWPYSLVSDTLQRIVFHLAAIETNTDSVIILEEPESHSFPYYTTFLAERIALDKTNQYFIATHNPYFLFSILEKAPKEDVGIFITYFEDYQTKVRPIKDEEMAQVFDLDDDIFLNLDKFIKSGKE
ncbi:MAG: AAA family ATPase [Planctomycetota bacterium]